MTNDKDEAQLAEKLTSCYNAHCKAKTTMTLATIQMEVKKFWRDIKETRDLMFSGSNKPGGNQNNSGQGQNKTKKKKNKRQRKKDKNKSGNKETVAQVSSDGDKQKENYCFSAGRTRIELRSVQRQGI